MPIDKPLSVHSALTRKRTASPDMFALFVIRRTVASYLEFLQYRAVQSSPEVQTMVYRGRRCCGLVLLFALAGTTLAQGDVEQIVFIHAGTLLARPGEPPAGPSTIVVRGSRIDSILEGHAPPPTDAELIDLRDQFVLPGLIDMHVHIFNDDDKMRARLQANNRDIEDQLLIGVDNARRTLEAGFTTIRDLGSNIRSVTALRDAINAGLVPGPTIVPAGTMISITAGHGDRSSNTNREASAAAREQASSLCDGADDCRRAVRDQVSQGAEVIKFAATGGVNSNISSGLEQQMFADEMRAIVDTAHLLGLKVAAHAHGKQGIKAALEAGVDSIEHGTYTDSETNELFKRSSAWLVPTMIAGAAALSQARAGARSEATLAKAELAVAVHAENTARAIRDGVRIAFGTDTGVSNHGDNAREFAMLVGAGMSPTAVIAAATVNAAELLGRSNEIGALERGRIADVVAVARSPLTDITELERVQFVMRRGVVVKLRGARQAFPPRYSDKPIR